MGRSTRQPIRITWSYRKRGRVQRTQTKKNRKKQSLRKNVATPMSEPIQEIILAGGNALQIAEAAQAIGVNDLRQSALVSVQGSQGFWERHGYAAQPLHDAVQRKRLAAYGAGAVYMVRGLNFP